MCPHDEMLSVMLDVLRPLHGSVRLVGRVADAVVGNRSPRDVFFFIPDLHLLTPEAESLFGGYRFNHGDTGVLARLLEGVARLGRRWRERAGLRLLTYQLGDFLDLWREPSSDAPHRWASGGVHPEICDLLFRGSRQGRPCLDATLLLGNHDVLGAVRVPGMPWRREAFNPCPEQRPFLAATHGDLFSVVEKLLPDGLKARAVNALGRLTPTKRYFINHWDRARSGMPLPVGTAVRAASGAAVAGDDPPRPASEFLSDDRSGVHHLHPQHGAIRMEPGRTLPEFLARRLERPRDSTRFKPIYRAVEVARRNQPEAARLRVVVVGHSHDARFEVCRPEDGGRPLVVMDVGAWIEECEYPIEEGGAIREPNAQLGVIHGNDARLYQISIPA